MSDAVVGVESCDKLDMRWTIVARWEKRKEEGEVAPEVGVGSSTRRRRDPKLFLARVRGRTDPNFPRPHRNLRRNHSCQNPRRLTGRLRSLRRRALPLVILVETEEAGALVVEDLRPPRGLDIGWRTSWMIGRDKNDL